MGPAIKVFFGLFLAVGVTALLVLGRAPPPPPGHDLVPIDIRTLVTEDLRTLSVDDIRRRGELVVLTRNAPTTVYEDRDGLLAGPEHDLLSAFAAEMGVALRYRFLDTVGEILDAMRAGGPHLAAAGLTVTELRKEEFLFGPPYRTVQQELVCRRGGVVPKNTEQLVGANITVIEDSSYADTLYEISLGLEGFEWNVTKDLDTEGLLERVWSQELDCTVADSNIVDVNRRYYPELVVPFPLTEEQELAWIVASRAPALLKELEVWFAGVEGGDLLAEIEYRYYSFVEEFDYVDTRAYYRRIDERLPRLAPLFQQAAQRHDLPWTVLAAMAYQESHWDPRARSPTGVRGLMMLTRAAAKEVGVENRVDPAQSVKGGALYLRRMMKRLPESITGEDRLWMAMAAYNVGLGHLYDARKLARRLGKNPDLWRDLREVLPLLSRKKYYRTLKHGYARGGEPVHYVRRIRNYLDILEQRLVEETEEALAGAGAVPGGPPAVATTD